MSLDRRSFLKALGATTVGLASSFVLGPIVRLGKNGLAFGDALKPLPETLDLAKNLGYKIDANKVDKKVRVDKLGVAGPKQTCANCNFFNASTGTCTMFQGYTVAAKGWCTVWTPKAG